MAVVPYASVASVVLAVVAIAVVPRWLAGRDGPQPAPTALTGDAPELGTIALPRASISRRPSKPDPPVGDRADLLATTQTRLGTARLFGFQTRSGAQCTAQDYVRPFLNSVGGTTCSPPGRDASNDAALGVGGTAETTPGAIKSPPLRYGDAPAGTRIVELSSPGIATVRAPARDGGRAYRHRAFYLAEFPLLVAGQARALDADGRVLATVQLKAPPASDAERVCGDSRAVTLSHLQGAVIIGQVYAKDHPESDDPTRLRFPEPTKGSTLDDPGLPDDVVLDRLGRASTAIGVMGPVETYEYRLAAVVVTGDGRTCCGPQVVGAAERFLIDSKGAAPLPSRFGK